jgi:hypothetical protein
VAGVRALSGGGRGLLVVGAAALLASLLLPQLTWFSLSGARPELPTGTYTGIQSTRTLQALAEGPYAWIGFASWIGFAWLFVCATAAIAIAGIGERTRRFGVSGILILLVYAGLLYFTAYRLNLPISGENAAVSIGYGFVAAVVGCALIEAGSRWPSRVPLRAELPAIALREEEP